MLIVVLEYQKGQKSKHDEKEKCLVKLGGYVIPPTKGAFHSYSAENVFSPKISTVAAACKKASYSAKAVGDKYAAGEVR